MGIWDDIKKIWGGRKLNRAQLPTHGGTPMWDDRYFLDGKNLLPGMLYDRDGKIYYQRQCLIDNGLLQYAYPYNFNGGIAVELAAVTLAGGTAADETVISYITYLKRAIATMVWWDTAPAAAYEIVFKEQGGAMQRKLDFTPTEAGAEKALTYVECAAGMELHADITGGAGVEVVSFATLYGIVI